METATKTDVLDRENEFMILSVGQERLTYYSKSKFIKTFFSTAQKKFHNTIFLRNIKNVYIISTKLFIFLFIS
jgi:hypothetical protein